MSRGETGTARRFSPRGLQIIFSWFRALSTILHALLVLHYDGLGVWFFLAGLQNEPLSTFLVKNWDGQSV